MAKATNHKVRARHCLIYTAGLAPVVVLGVEGVEQGAFCLAILFASHFLIDTYMPVYLWAKYLRRPPTMADNESVAPLSEMAKFKEFASTPIGILLVVSMDQAYHVLFLVPVAAVMLWPELWVYTAFMTTVAMAPLLASVVFGARKVKA